MRAGTLFVSTAALSATIAASPNLPSELNQDDYHVVAVTGALWIRQLLREVSRDYIQVKYTGFSDEYSNLYHTFKEQLEQIQDNRGELRTAKEGLLQVESLSEFPDDAYATWFLLEHAMKSIFKHFIKDTYGSSSVFVQAFNELPLIGVHILRIQNLADTVTNLLDQTQSVRQLYPQCDGELYDLGHILIQFNSQPTEVAMITGHIVTLKSELKNSTTFVYDRESRNLIRFEAQEKQRELQRLQKTLPIARYFVNAGLTILNAYFQANPTSGIRGRMNMLRQFVEQFDQHSQRIIQSVRQV